MRHRFALSPLSAAVAGLFVASLALSANAPAQSKSDLVQTGSDIPAKWVKPEAGYDYVKREVMIPMRDGVEPPSPRPTS